MVVERNAASSAVAIHAAWAGGVRSETRADNGISYLLARSITRGCGGRDARAVTRRTADLGGTMSGTSGRNTFGLRARWPRHNWVAGMGLVADCIAGPRFERDAFLRARASHRVTIAQHARDGASVAVRLLLRTLYGAHPYRLDPLGDAAAVASFTRRAVRAYYRTQYPLGKLVVVVVGNVDPARAVREIRRVLGLASGGVPRRAGPTLSAGPSVAAREVYTYLQRPYAELVIGFPGATFASADRYALAVLVELLGGPMGTLTAAARATGGVVHPVRVRSVPGIEPGFFAVHATCKPAQVSTVYAALRARLASLASERFGATLGRAKRKLIAIDRASRRQVSSVASALAFHEVHGLGLRAYAGYAAALERVTVAELQRVARVYLDVSRAVTVTVAPAHMSPGAARRVRGVRKRAPRRRRSRRSARSH